MYSARIINYRLFILFRHKTSTPAHSSGRTLPLSAQLFCQPNTMARVASTASARAQRGGARSLPNRAAGQLQRERSVPHPARAAERLQRRRSQRGKQPRRAKAAASADGGAGVKKPHRYRPGTVALREIRRYQKSVDYLIPKLSFQRMLKDMTHNSLEQLKDMQRTKLEDIPRMQVTTVNCLQTASGAKLTEMFDGANPCTIHDNRVTVMKKDLVLALRLAHDPSLEK